MKFLNHSHAPNKISIIPMMIKGVFNSFTCSEYIIPIFDRMMANTVTYYNQEVPHLSQANASVCFRFLYHKKNVPSFSTNLQKTLFFISQKKSNDLFSIVNSPFIAIFDLLLQSTRYHHFQATLNSAQNYCFL